MSQNEKITDVFKKFAGCEFPLSFEEKDDPKHGKIGHFKITDHDHPTVNQMVEEAGRSNLKVFFKIATFGGGYEYGDKDGGTLEATVEQAADGKWRVGKEFTVKP